ncbi:UDP-glucose dehydrogenase family protein [Brevibacillus sp. SYSU BS000544]|uniref:UDP-glucose dehydrogenase family protein n=1 Tax=Brevibacillus sp. SYSU BS000544 TaxID=3416443 RepID=UPI003CE4DB61
MKIAVIGTGYVGLTTAISLAMYNHQVTCIDMNEQKINQLNQGIIPIYEPGMDEMLQQVVKEKRIRFTTSLDECALQATIFFICVGTPSDYSGKADLRYVYQAVSDVKKALAPSEEYKLIVLKSTVPVGTADQVSRLLGDRSDILLVSNPEFLREGNAMHDSLHPSRIVIGSASDAAKRIMERVYAGFEAPNLFTTTNNAEMIKYASNAFLATKISFANELARLCDKVNADIRVVTQGMGLDSRIGPEFLHAGIGYGGSCFPKDTAALVEVAKENDVELTIIEKAIKVNRTQPDWFLSKLSTHFQDAKGLRIALLGLSFKPDTDDIREAPALTIIEALLEKEAELTVYDPVASEHVKELYPRIRYATEPYEALANADAAILVTEWKQLLELDWNRVMEVMSNSVLFDGRNAWPVQHLRSMGFTYFGVGRQTP